MTVDAPSARYLDSTLSVAERVTETVQVYVGDVVTCGTWTDKELKAFTQVEPGPGEQEDVLMELPISACSIVKAHGARVVEPGTFELLVGRSSKDADLVRALFEVSTS
ncbi:fibronectin type III-like domain-contianing protein [Tessaracoccus sp. Z1128]